jgi:CzcA family heavy metal efflux pump
MIISDTALKNRTSVLFLTFLLSVIGLIAYINLPRESFPEVKIPFIMVTTPYPGVSPEDVESLITTPIEKKLKEISDIKEIRSSSLEGMSFISIEFEPDIDLDVALQKVRDKIDLAKPDIPKDAKESQIKELNFDNVPVMIINLYAPYDLVKLKKVAEDLKDELENVTGVLEIRMIGGLEREVQVDLDPARLSYYNISDADVVKAIQGENKTIPGGTIKIGKLKYLVRIPGEYKDPELLKNIMLKDTGSKIYLRDVATVKFGYKEAETISRVNGQSSISLSVVKRAGENIVEIAREAKDILKERAEYFPKGTNYMIMSDMSKDIKRLVNELENNIIAGLILVILVLYFFMGTRNGVLVGIAIPLSMLISFIVISMLGYTLNMIVLFSLILALGMLVDNAIVVVENIYRHRQEGYSLWEAARAGTSEVAVPIITSTITTLVAFSPLIFWEGIVGNFMELLPITLIITLSSSLFVGLVINPVVASRFVKVSEKPLKGQPLLDWMIQQYDKTINWSIDHPYRVLSIAFGSFFAILILYSTLFFTGIEFFPNTEPKQIMIDVDTQIGTRLSETDRIIKQIEKIVPDLPDVKAYVANVGSLPAQGVSVNPGKPSNLGRITIDLLDREMREYNSFDIVKMIREKTGNIVGARVDVSYPRHGPPTGKPVQIELSGDDYHLLGKLARDIRNTIKDIPGLVDLKDDYSAGNPEVHVIVDREKARLFGLSTAIIASAIRTAVNGTEASKYRVADDEYDIVVRYKEKSRSYVEQLREIPLFHKGKRIALANVAKIIFSGGSGTVRHVDLDKVVTITGSNAEGVNANALLQKVKRRLADYPFTRGVNIKYTGQDKEQKKAMAFLTRAFMIAFLLIFFVLISQFDSMTLPFIIMTSVFLSMMGVLFGLIVTGLPFGVIMTGIGIISLAGVVVNNAIVLIDYINKLRARGLGLREAIIAGGKTRLRPVLLTAVTTVLGLVPLTLGINIDFIGLLTGDFHNLFEFGAESSQFWRNMGWAVIFGLTIATALTLLVVPSLYYLTVRISEYFDKKFHLGKFSRENEDSGDVIKE